MSPSPVIETIPQDLTSRLQRIGSALTDSAASRRSIRPVMSAGDRASRPRRRRDALAALVVAIAGVTMSTLTFSAGTGDPVIGVIPKNTAHRDILWIRLNVPAPDDAPPWYRLINVDGTDVMIAEETDRTKSSDSAATLTEIAGRKVSLVDSERSASASWMLENQRAFGLTMAPKNPKFRAVVEAVVQQSVAQQPDASSPTAFTTPRMKEVERRDLGVASLFIELKGTTRGSGNEVANGVFSQEVPISEQSQRSAAAPVGVPTNRADGRPRSSI